MPSVNEDLMSIVTKTKEYLAEDRLRIKLYDFIALCIQEAISEIDDDFFSVGERWTDEKFLQRIKKYQAIMSPLCNIQALLAYWGTDMYAQTFALAPSRFSDLPKSEGGITVWIALRWYPVLLLVYYGGVAAVASGRYDNLRKILCTTIPDKERSGGQTTVINAVVSAFRGIDSVFKNIPEHRNHLTPQSEYLFNLLQGDLNNLFYLGGAYEAHFDRFELISALEFVEQNLSESSGFVWGPIGRFGWKFYRCSGGIDPLNKIVAEAKAEGEAWPPIKAGFFRGSIQRFNEVSSKYYARIAKLGWY